MDSTPRPLFERNLSVENSEVLICIYDWLYSIHCHTSFSCIDLSTSLCALFHPISSNIYEVHLINLFASEFVFGHFNILHKVWLTYFDGTNRTRKFWYKSSISSNLIEMFNYPAAIFDCDWHSPVLLHLSFIFILLWLSFHGKIVVMLLSHFSLICLSLYLKQDPSFRCTCYDIWLKWTSLSFKKCFIEGYTYPWCFGCCCCCWILCMGPDWNWCIYPSSEISFSPTKYIFFVG